MRRYNTVSQILLILSISTIALATPVLVQEERQACAHEALVPRDVITVLGKRVLGVTDNLHMLWDAWHFGDVWGEPEEHEPLLDLGEAYVHTPPLNPAGVQVPEAHGLPLVPVPEGHAPPPDLAGVHAPEVHVPPHDPADSDSESMVFDSDAPPPESPKESTESEYWYTPLSSPSRKCLPFPFAPFTNILLNNNIPSP